jgi:hypothetical protein
MNCKTKGDIMQKMSKLITQVVFDMRMKLSQTYEVDQFEHEDIRDTLNSLYNKGAKLSDISGTFVNSILATNNMVFMISKNIFIKLVKYDKNHKWKSVNTEEYKLFMAKLFKCETIECIRQPQGNKAGLYKVKDKDLVDMLKSKQTDEYFKKQEEVINIEYERYLKTDRKTKSEEIYDENDDGVTFEDLKQDPEFIKLKNKKKEA